MKKYKVEYRHDDELRTIEIGVKNWQNKKIIENERNPLNFFISAITDFNELSYVNFKSYFYSVIYSMYKFSDRIYPDIEIISYERI